MQKTGDVCDSCKERWEKKNLEPKILQSASGKTINHKLFVPLCPHCDGGAIEVSERDDHSEPQEA